MKKLFGSPRHRVSGAGLMIAMLALVASVGTALAATLPPGGSSNPNFNVDNTLIGTPNVPDTITDGNGNDIIYGLGGNTTSGDAITAGRGNDEIVADGMCTQGFDTITPGHSEANYCEPGQGNQNEGNTSISVGGGNDLIIGGGGRNTISVAARTQGNDIVVGGKSGGDTITTSNGNNQIFLGRGASYTTGSTVSDGHGDSVIHAQNGVADMITCAPGNATKVYADKSDKVKGCAQVITATPDPNPSYQFARDRAVSSKHGSHKAKKGAHHNRRHRSR
jgi:hypothetical protein